MDGACLAVFMISACFFTALLEHPSSPARQAIESPFIRHLLIGMAMGLTLIAIVHSPWGKRSGAHLNPSLTWTFFRLGKVQTADALFYSVAQFAGGILGVIISAVILRETLTHPAVRYAVTVPGESGAWVAFVAEIAISFVLMLTVLIVSNNRKLTRFTPFFAGALVATYITFEAPLSGMSMNPARTVGSALPANVWTSAWVYFIAPVIGMLAAAETYVRLAGARNVFCAKFHHHNDKRCIFRCNYDELLQLVEPAKLKAPVTITSS